MSQAQLAALERDVEQARSRFAHDLARLRSPATFSAFKDELVAEKDELVDRVKDATRDRAQRILNDLKDKAAANPVAALAIGAGLAWRMIRHPPIASLLVGYGLVSLLRTSPSQRSRPYMDLHDEDAAARWKDKGLAARASELADSVKDRVQEWGAGAGETARETISQLSDKASSVADRASDTARSFTERASDTARSFTERASDTARSFTERASDTARSVAERASATARSTAGQISDKAADMTDKVSTAVYEAIPEEETRDKILLGTAALAVAAAVGIAYQRRQAESVEP
jgi:hypothetical protein